VPFLLLARRENAESDRIEWSEKPEKSEKLEGVGVEKSSGAS
jgi:hypothetical protein